jgi:hypothetical protein
MHLFDEYLRKRAERLQRERLAYWLSQHPKLRPASPQPLPSAYFAGPRILAGLAIGMPLLGGILTTNSIAMLVGILIAGALWILRTLDETAKSARIRAWQIQQAAEEWTREREEAAREA